MTYSQSIENKLKKLPDYVREYAVYKSEIGYSDGTIINELRIISRFLQYSDAIDENMPDVERINYDKMRQFLESFKISSKGSYSYYKSMDSAIDSFLDYIYTKYYPNSLDNHFPTKPIIPSLSEAKESFVEYREKIRCPRIPIYSFGKNDFERLIILRYSKSTEEEILQRISVFIILMATGISRDTVCELRIENYSYEESYIMIGNNETIYNGTVN